MSNKKVAVVTGGNRGIGLEICRGLVNAGVHVVLCSRDLAAGEIAAAELRRDGGLIDAHALDVNVDASAQTLASLIGERFGYLDILVNNAGILIDNIPRALDLEADALMRLMDTNVAGPLRVTRALAPLLRKSKAGRIVNMSSALGQLSYKGSDRPGYRLSKLALNGLTRMLAEEFAADGIKVNAATPGWVRTRMGGDAAPLSPADGADTPLWLALLPDDGPSGGLFNSRKLLPW
ncbi:MAG: SDR family oxidoreductase [Burkholderiales bacterium]